MEKKKMGCAALDDLVGQITDTGKNMNVIQKSKIDWSTYTKE